MKISVVIPTYLRPNDLARCLQALCNQTRLPDEVLVVIRDTDVETKTLLESFNLTPFPLQTIIVNVPGVVAAMNVGWDKTQGDIIVSTDDDAAPHSDWLAKIETYFLSDQQIAGVGGRDWQYQGSHLKEEGTPRTVGKVQWFGRVIGNHHLGTGKAREVDVLKGVNMGFRRAAIQGLHFDERMRGMGAQVNFEMAFALPLRRRGWKIIYDPSVAVDHYPAQRFDEDQIHRGQFSAIALSNIAHNETLALLEYLSPIQRIIFLIWAVVIGTRECPGLVQVLRFLPSRRFLIVRKWLATINGRWQGIQSWLHSERAAVVPPPGVFEHSNSA
ncbi:glycosyl transferase family 2 [Crinalium epipsammum PCC 9333]|uniref:Glycosyl transferase family 2 n=1 Tax=Crinalium epipsammum PCC 9333 TaxID=1173022 RepID=K9W083_9CYAN|nr:glycosyltransferase [Crinalium epipsammum]AFZ13616.1 glycosyl transferase family 2 [Crinalium epipsammum PCC 9333]